MGKKQKETSDTAKPMKVMLKHLHHAYIGKAVLEVLFYNQKYAAPIQKFDAAANVWAVNSTLRRDIFDRVKLAWCRLAKKDFTWFPYSEDYVAGLYLMCCKKDKHQLRKWEDELKEALTFATTKP